MGVDLIGQKFTRLTVVKFDGMNKWKQRLWLCVCSCGKKKSIVSYQLSSGGTKSCGCLQKEIVTNKNIKHNHARRKERSRTYTTWTSMIQRCGDQNCIDYPIYGGRGIIVCKRWQKFVNFLKDMGEIPSGFQLDRVDNNRGYDKSNCRWSTPKQQGRNRRNNRMIFYKDKRQCLSAWAEEYGVNYKLLWKRICVYNWPIEKALTTPKKQQRIYLS